MLEQFLESDRPEASSQKRPQARPLWLFGHAYRVLKGLAVTLFVAFLLLTHAEVVALEDIRLQVGREMSPAEMLEEARRNEELRRFKEAEFWYARAAHNGSAEAHLVLAEVYRQGYFHGAGFDGVGFLRRDFTAAAERYEQAAALLTSVAAAGDANAMVKLGLLYHSGLGVTVDHEKALRLWRAAVEKGSAEGAYALGYHGYWHREAYDKALPWLLQAAEEGLPDAQYLVGQAYQDGRGVDRDYEKARRWILQAAEGGHPKAVRDANSMRAQGML